MTELLMVTEETEAHVNKNLDTVNQTMDNYQQILAQANALIPADWEAPARPSRQERRDYGNSRWQEEAVAL